MQRKLCLRDNSHGFEYFSRRSLLNEHVTEQRAQQADVSLERDVLPRIAAVSGELQ